MLPTTLAKRSGSGNPSTMNFDRVSAVSSETYWPRAWATETTSPSSFNRSSRLSLRFRGENNDYISRHQAGADEFAHRVHEERISLTELDEMLRHTHLTPGCYYHVA